MHDLRLCILTALIVVVQCETIHFTNSPSHLIGTTNMTSYKLLVKNSDPITIIEANKDNNERPQITKYHDRYHANDRIDINVDDGADSVLQDYPIKLLANMGGSHQMNSKNTQNVRGTVGFSVTGGPSNVPGSNKDFTTSDLNADSDSTNANPKKVVYSPILLKKFMQEYAEKLKNADNSVKSEIQKIHDQIHGQQPTHADKSEFIEFDKSIENAEQKFNLNGYRDSYDEDRRKRPSNSYKDRDGWVTLEAVPWSSSTVSKWHPNGGDEDTRRRPAARPYNNKPDKFPYHDDSDDDYYRRPKPNVDRNSRPSVYSTWTKPQPLDPQNSNDRPRPKPYKFSESGSFGSNKYHDNDHDRYSSSRPWSSNGDIITDNRPSNFPSESHATKYHDDDHYYTASSNNHATYQDRPSESNGEWVLISTTKGYQFPNRRQQGKRAQFHPDKQSSVTVNVPQSIRMHKALKLTVLPALDPAKNSTFSTDSKRKPTTTLTHGGMLEIDATHETIEDDVRATFLAQKKLTTVKPVKIPSTDNNKNRKLLKVITTKNGQDQSTEILAAIGAGLVPATMAFLVPLALGRKRRSIEQHNEHQNSKRFQQNTFYPLLQPM